MNEENEYLRVNGFCPACSCRTLVLYQDEKDIVCRSKNCPDPYSLHKIIQDDEMSHIVYFNDDKTFTMLHPLRERLNEELASCDAGDHLSSLSGPPVTAPGKYRMRKRGPSDDYSYSYILLTE